MRILHVIGDLAPQSGGPAKACVEMAQAVAERGHQVDIFTTNFGRPESPRQEERGQVTLYNFPLQQPKVWLSSWPMRHALAARAGQYDLLHIHSLYLFHDWAAYRACRRHRVPYILRPHGTLDPYIYRRHRLKKRVFDLWYQNRMLREASAIHYTAEDEKTLAEPFVHGAPGFVVPNGIHIDEYTALPPRGAFRRHHPEIGDDPIILFMARINFKKGLDLLTEAFSQLKTKAWLVIAGPDGGFLNETRRLIERWDIAERTILPGMVRGADKLSLLADADLFALPSYSENFGIAVVEAMAAGLPVILSDRVNIWREVVADGAGLAVEPDAGQLAQALQSLLDDPARRRAMGMAGRTKAAARYDWSHVGAQLEDAYRRVLAQAGS